MNQYASVVASLDMTTPAPAAASGREEAASSTRSPPTSSTSQAQQSTQSDTLAPEATPVPPECPEPEPSTTEYVKMFLFLLNTEFL